MDDRRFDNLTRLAATATRRGLLKTLIGAAGGGLLTLTRVRPAAAAPCFAGGPVCAGCCSNQFCRDGDSPQECGKNGAPCRVCADGEECRDTGQEWTCVPKEECSADSCPDGCCSGGLLGTSESVCYPGTDQFFCGGPMGATCASCDDDEICVNRSCVECNAETCAGCCDRDGEFGVECEPGTERENCGTGGVTCRACAAGERCERGQCVACNAGNCRGCCTPEGTCADGNSSFACGAGGRPCQRCSSGQSCINGVCQECDADSCPDGCCEGGLLGEICVSPPTDASCGRSGQQCHPCLERDGVACEDGVCRCALERCAAAKNGCCADSFCWDGDTGARCGAGGGPCDDCGIRGAACVNRVCQCDPELCAAFEGCCAGDRCEAGDTERFCGTDGGACVACATGQTCRDGRCVCDLERCLGCCSGDACEFGDSPFACGIFGEPCRICATDELCLRGVCVPCRENCDGCCDGQFCRPGTDRAACGRGGEPCVLCDLQAGEQCVDGTCRGPCNAQTCPTGCCFAGSCAAGTADAACGTGGAVCRDCRQGGQVCRNQACASGDDEDDEDSGDSGDGDGEDGEGEDDRVGGRPTTRPDFAYAVVRPTDLGDDADRVVTTPGRFYDGREAGAAAGVLDERLLAVLPGSGLGPGFQQTIGIPTSTGAASGWDRTVTTWHQSFAGMLGADVIPTFLSTYLTGTAPLRTDPTIGDGAFFHGWSGQTSDGGSFTSTMGVFSDGARLGAVRVDDYTGGSPDLDDLHDLLRTVVDRATEVYVAAYRNLGTDATALPRGDDPSQWVFTANYTAYDGTRFRPSTQDDTAFALDQERFAEIERGYGLVQPIPIDRAEAGPVVAIYGTSSDRFVNADAAQAYFGRLDDYLAEDGPREGFTAERRPAESPLIIRTPPLAELLAWQYRRQTEQGTLPGTEIALNAGDTVTKFNVRGAVPIPDGSHPTAEYQAAIDDVAATAATDYLARAFGDSAASPEELDALVDAAFSNLIVLQQACVAGELERCVTAAQLVATEEEPATGETDAAGPLDLAGAVLTPVDFATAFGLDVATFQATPGFTFFDIENAAAAGFGAFDATPPRVPPPAPLAAHHARWLHRDAAGQIDVNSFGVIFQTAADWISNWLRDEYLAGASEVPHELDSTGVDVRLFEAAGQSVAGNPFYSQYAIVRQGGLVGLLSSSFLGDTWGNDDDYWIVARRYAGEFGGFQLAPQLGDTPLVQTLAERLAQVQQPDHADLGTSFPSYSGASPAADLIFRDGFESGDTSAWSVYQENYTVVENRTIRQTTQTDEQNDHSVRANDDVERAYQRVDIVGSGDPASTGATSSGQGAPVLSLGRTAARYTGASAATAGFAALDAYVETAAALAPNLQVIPDRETETPGFRLDHKWYRFLLHDETSQQAGVKLFLGHDDRIVGFEVSGAVPIRNEDAFAEPYIRSLYDTARVAALDYHTHNGLDHDLSDDEADELGDQLGIDVRTFFSGGSTTVQGPPVVEEPEVSEPIAEGCPPGWAFDAAGPSGAGCYRCSYPHLTGTVYSVERHGCVRNGEDVDGAPRELVL